MLDTGRRSATASTGATSTSARLVFLGGVASGGTDLLESVVNAHGQIFMPGEFLFFAAAADRYRAAMPYAEHDELIAELRRLDEYNNSVHHHYWRPMTEESYAQHWSTAAKARAEQGILDEMVSNELFDHTWIASIHQLEKHLRFADGHTVLDAGCGWGRLLLGVKYFHPGVSIDGYELTPEFASKARELLQLHGLANGAEIVQADLLEIELPRDHYDSLYSSRVVHYIQEKDLLIRKFHAALKEGGRAMIVIPNRSCPYQWLAYKHAPLYPIRSVGRIMETTGFKRIRYGGYRVLPSSRRFAHDSVAARIEIAVSSTPLGRFGGLAYVVGEK